MMHLGLKAGGYFLSFFTVQRGGEGLPERWVLVGKPQHISALPTSAPAARELPQHHPNSRAGSPAEINSAHG